MTDLMNIDPTMHAPPVLLFTWGSLSFTCVLARASQRYIMFRPDGVPVRARVQVTFNEFRNADLEAKEVKRETADYTKTYTGPSGRDTERRRRTRVWQPETVAAYRAGERRRAIRIDYNRAFDW